MRLILTTLAIAGAITLAIPANAQQYESEHSTATHPRDNADEPHFRFASFISHTFIPGLSDGARIAIPSYGIDLEYWFNNRWGIGLHNDIELETFIVERENNEFTERRFPIVTTLDLLYHHNSGLVFVIGPGLEFDINEKFMLFRVGLEYELELEHHWDLYPTIFYDMRADAFTTFTFGLGIGKRF
jgi:hypothetical protein